MNSNPFSIKILNPLNLNPTQLSKWSNFNPWNWYQLRVWIRYSARCIDGKAYFVENTHSIATETEIRAARWNVPRRMVQRYSVALLRYLTLSRKQSCDYIRKTLLIRIGKLFIIERIANKCEQLYNAPVRTHSYCWVSPATEKKALIPFAYLSCSCSVYVLAWKREEHCLCYLLNNQNCCYSLRYSIQQSDKCGEKAFDSRNPT